MSRMIVKDFATLKRRSDNFKSVWPELCEINPDFAKELLKRNTHNRKEKKGAQRRYAADMSADAFEYNGDTIVMGHDGVLIDGQNRLEAVVSSGKTITTIVAFAPPEAFKTKDSGVGRSARDMFTVMERPNSTVLSTALKNLYYFKKDKFVEAMYGGALVVTNSMLDAFNDEFSEEEQTELDDWVTKTQTWAKRAAKSRVVFNMPRVAALCFLWGRKYPATTIERFLDLVTSGIDANGLGVGPNNQPVIFYLREELSKLFSSGDNSHLARGNQAGMLINAFHLFRANKKVKSNTHIKYYVRKGEPELPFPEVFQG